MDPRDFAQAQIVDVVGRQRQRRVLLDQIGIELGTALHVDQPDALARDRQIFLRQEVAQPLIGRADLVADHRRGLGAQACLVGFGDARGEGLERRVEGRSLDALRQLQVELVDDVAHDQLGLDHARLHTLAEATDRRVDDIGIAVMPADIVLIILHRLERRHALAGGEVRIERVEAGEVVDRPDDGERQEIGAERAQRQVGLPFEDVVGELVGRRERLAIDPAKRRAILLARRALGVEIGVADIVAQLVGIAHVAAEQRIDRIAAEIVLVALLEQRVERRGGLALGRGGLLRRRRAALARRRAGRDKSSRGYGEEKVNAQGHAPELNCIAWMRHWAAAGKPYQASSLPIGIPGGICGSAASSPSAAVSASRSSSSRAVDNAQARSSASAKRRAACARAQSASA